MSNQDREINIINLKWYEHIRTRPGMYVGVKEGRLETILREVIDNSIDELLNCSYCDRVEINTLGDFAVVSDNGRGIPITLTEEGITQTELGLSRLNSGSKFNKEGETAIGMNGVGAKCTNALSKEFIVASRVTESNFDKSIDAVKSRWKESGDKSDLFYCIVWNQGKKKYEGCKTRTEIVEEMRVETPNFDLPFGFSTHVFFAPDPEFFDDVTIKIPKSNLQNTSFVFKNMHKKDVTIKVNSELVVSNIEPYRYSVDVDIIPKDTEKNPKIRVYATWEYDENLTSSSGGSVNTLVTDTGWHVSCIQWQLFEGLKSKFNIQHNYYKIGMKLFVIVLASEVDYSSQNKTHVTEIPGVSLHCLNDIGEKMQIALSEDLEGVENHIARLDEYAASMEKMSHIEAIKSMVQVTDNEERAKGAVPKEVSDASSSERSKCELYIVEGDSAGGTLKKARNKQYHAILPLKGNPVNAVALGTEQMMSNKELNVINTALGMGVDDYYKLENSRYGKVIICADSDPDGAKIAAALMVGFFGAHMKFLIDAGMLFIGVTPLYKQGDNYYYSGEESKLDPDQYFTRFKGLGEFNSEQLRDLLMTEGTRRLIQVTSEGLDEALELVGKTKPKAELMLDMGVMSNPYRIR